MVDKEEERVLHELILENKRLLTENNQLLKQLRKSAVINFWFRIVWVAFLIGLPFILYYYVIEPYFVSFGSSFETFMQGMQEIPGWKQYYESRGE